MKGSRSPLPRTRLLLAFLLFAPAALLFPAPPGQRVGALAAYLVLWCVCLSCIFLMAQITVSLRNRPVLAITSAALLLFLLQMAAVRLLAFGALWPRTAWFLHHPQFLQILGALIVALCAPLVLPHVRSILEGSAAARKERNKFLAAAESTLDDFYLFDGIPDASGDITDFTFAYINPNAQRRLNIQRGELLGQVLTTVRPFMISSGLIEEYRKVVRTGIPFSAEIFIDDDRIKATWIHVQVVKLGDGLAVTSRDFTERKRLTDHVNQLAHYDQLTGLANRTLLHDRLHNAILRARRNHQKIAIFMIDIDRFKHINDSLGHADGDALLAAVGKRLAASVRESDTVARMGGDEFVLIMPDINSLEDVERCGQKIIQSATRPITLGDRELSITLSVGLCIFPDCGLDADQLLKNADIAMYVVKDSGRNGLHIYTEGMQRETAGQP